MNAVLELFDKWRSEGQSEWVDRWRVDTVKNRYYRNIELDEWSRDGGY